MHAVADGMKAALIVACILAFMAIVIVCLTARHIYGGHQWREFLESIRQRFLRRLAPVEVQQSMPRGLSQGVIQATVAPLTTSYVKVAPSPTATKDKTTKVKGSHATTNAAVDSDTAEECSICLDTFEDSSQVVTLACSHIYHSECIKRWLHQDSRCPLCKARVTPK